MSASAMPRGEFVIRPSRLEPARVAESCLGVFSRLPQGVRLIQLHFTHRLARDAGGGLKVREAPSKTLVGLSQGCLRIDVSPAGIVDHRKEQISRLGAARL